MIYKVEKMLYQVIAVLTDKAFAVALARYQTGKPCAEDAQSVREGEEAGFMKEHRYRHLLPSATGVLIEVDPSKFLTGQGQRAVLLERAQTDAYIVEARS